MSQKTHYSPVTKKIERCSGNCIYGEESVTTDSDGNEFVVMHSRDGESAVEFLGRVERYEEAAALDREGGVYGTFSKSEPEELKTIEDFEDKSNPAGAFALYNVNRIEDKIQAQNPNFEFTGGRNKYMNEYQYAGKTGNYQDGRYSTVAIYDNDTGELTRATINVEVQENSWNDHYSAGEDYYTEEEYTLALYRNGLIEENPNPEHHEDDEEVSLDLRDHLADRYGSSYH